MYPYLILYVGAACERDASETLSFFGTPWFWAPFIGMAVAVGQLYLNFSQNRIRSLICAPSLVYVGIHILAPVIVLLLIKENGSQLLKEHPINTCLTVGFGAVVLLRANVNGAKGKSWGPGNLLVKISDAADRRIEQNVRRVNILLLKELLKTASYEELLALLPTMCMFGLRTFTEEEMQSFTNEVEKINASGGGSYLRSLKLCIELAKHCPIDFIIDCIDRSAVAAKHVDNTGAVSSLEYDNWINIFGS